MSDSTEANFDFVLFIYISCEVKVNKNGVSPSHIEIPAEWTVQPGKWGKVLCSLSLCSNTSFLKKSFMLQYV